MWNECRGAVAYHGVEEVIHNIYENIARIANAVQCHSLLSGHYD